MAGKPSDTGKLMKPMLSNFVLIAMAIPGGMLGQTAPSPISSYAGMTPGALEPGQPAESYQISGLGRIDAARSHLSGDLTVVNNTSSYQYTALDGLKLVLQGAQSRSFQYDTAGRMVEAVNPENGTTEYRYDLSGNLNWKRDALGVVVSTVYDGVQRPASRTFATVAGVASASLVGLGIPWKRVEVADGFQIGRSESRKQRRGGH